MNVFNDNNELKHPAFHDEKIEKKKKIWVKILDFLYGVIVVLGLVAWVLFCVWMMYFREIGD